MAKKYIVLLLAAVLIISLVPMLINAAYAAETIFCPECGKQIPADSKFCNCCGKAIPEGPALNAEKPLLEDDVSEGMRDWNALMQLPTREEISSYNQSSDQRSPYVAAWFDTKTLGKFKEIAVDFKADYLPSGTYCSLANFDLDYSALEKKYERIENNHIAGYAGFQRNDIDPERYNSILSFWDVFCYDADGNMTKVQAKQIFPEDLAPTGFYWEGTGVNCLREYSWKAEKWYRLLLQCGRSSDTGNTTIEYWVLDLESNSWTKLCVFDLGVPDVTFKGNVAVFLENFQKETSGEIRTMEFKNFRVHRVETKDWESVESVRFYENSASSIENLSYSGSYKYGSDGETFWIITTGVPQHGSEEQGKIFSITNSETGKPY